MPEGPKNLHRLRSDPVKQRRTFLLAVLIPIGLGTKFYHGFFEQWVHQYAGDVLYAMFLLLLLRLLRQKTSQLHCAIIVGGFCIAIECSQLIRTPFLQMLRRHFIGALILGNGFDWLDIPHYFIGIALAAGIDDLISKRL